MIPESKQKEVLIKHSILYQVSSSIDSIMVCSGMQKFKKFENENENKKYMYNDEWWQDEMRWNGEGNILC